MYKAAQEKQDWIARTGNHATRPVLHANANPKPLAKFEVGRLAELKDEHSRLKRQLAHPLMKPRQHLICARIGAIKDEIRRLNREAAETSEQALMWQALRQVFSEDDVRRFTQALSVLRLTSEGYSAAEISTILSPTPNEVRS